MKTIPICLIFIIYPLFVLAQLNNGDTTGPPSIVAEHDGQPGCHLRYEFRRLWRNNFVPEQYWECTRWQQPAVSRHCPVATRFQDSWQSCVPFSQWQWTPYSEPPTRPCHEKTLECEELDIENECKVTTETPETTQGTTPSPTTENPCPCEPGTTTTTTTTTTENPCPCLDSETTTPADSVIIQCAGASANQHSPGTVDCNHIPDRSTCTVQSNARRLPTSDPSIYFQCNFLIGWQIVTCPLNSCFDGHLGVCIGASFWSNVCQA